MVINAVVVTLEIDDVGGSGLNTMRAKVWPVRRATLEMLLAYLNEKRVRVVCRQMGVDATDRLKSLGTAFSSSQRSSIENREDKPGQASLDHEEWSAHRCPSLPAH